MLLFSWLCKETLPRIADIDLFNKTAKMVAIEKISTGEYENIPWTDIGGDILSLSTVVFYFATSIFIWKFYDFAFSPLNRNKVIMHVGRII